MASAQTDSSALFRAYRCEFLTARMPGYTRLGAGVAFGINTAFMALDYFSFPEHFRLFLVLRLGLNALFGASYLASERFPRVSAWSICMSLGAAMLMMIFATGGAESRYFAGLMLLFLGMGVVLPLSGREAAGICGAILMPFLAAPWLGSGSVDWSIFRMHAVFLLAAAAESVVSCVYLESMRFNDFRQRRELQQARDHLEGLDRVKSRFAANVHHELRTPLTLILAPLEAMIGGQFGELSEQQSRYLETMRVNAQRLLKLISNLLDLAKIETHSLRLRRQRLQVGRMLADLVTGALPLAERKEIRLEMSGLDELPEVNADFDAAEKILLNLLGNALKFTDRGGRIAVVGSAEDDGIHLVVSDDGPGIPEDKLEHIFDRFAQVDVSATRQHEGTGIGLALARELVELHGGRIWAESEGLECGSQFHVVLPWGEADVAAEDTLVKEATGLESWRGALDAELDRSEKNEAGPAPAQPAAASSEPRMRMLVAEDNAEMRDFLVTILASQYEVHTATNGREGLEAALAIRPDLVLTDIMMPEMSGTELCQALQADPRTKSIPVILLTAKDDQEMRVEGLLLGARDYVTKPFHPQELLARVHGVAKVQRLQRELSNRNTVLKSTVFELKETEVQLVQAERLAAVGELAAGVAHEVNNPVNFALNSLQMLRERVDDVRTLLEALAGVDRGDTRELQGAVRRVDHLKEKLGFEELASDLEELVMIAAEGLERTHRLVGDLQNFATPGSRMLEPVDVREGLAATIRLMRAAACDVGASVESEFDLDLPPVHSCANMLNQIFLNLLKNAVEALEGRGGTIRISASRDRDEGGKRDDVVIAVSDDGPGVASEIRERLFEPFVTTKTTGRGAGLGLSVCRRILDELGGTIDLRSTDSAPSRGTTFEIRLPVSTERTQGNEITLG